MIRALLLSLSLLLLAACGSSPVREPEPLVEFKPELKLQTLWKTNIGQGIGDEYFRLAPVIANDHIYVADKVGHVVALNRNNGKVIWKKSLKLPISGGTGYGGGMLLLGSQKGELIALNADNGSIKWRTQLSSEILSVPQYGLNTVIAHTADGKLFALEAADGKLRWNYDRTVPVLSLRGTSSPVILGDAVLEGFGSGKIAAMQIANGRLLWENSVASPKGVSELERMIDVDAPPLLHNGLVFVVTYQGRLTVFDMRSGRPVWDRNMSAYQPMTADARAVYVSDADDVVWSLERNTGGSLWKQSKLLARKITGPALIDNYVVVGDFEGYLHWMSREDGHFVARNQIDSEGILVSPISYDAVLYVYGRSGTLMALRPKH